MSKRFTLFKRFKLAAAALAFVCSTTLAQAQSYPSKPLRIVIPYPPGGITDLVARQVAQKLQDSLGQPVIVDNRPGGNFVIAADLVAKSAPDGYTLLLAPDSIFTLNPLTLAKLPYDTARDFAPISMIALQTLFIVANPKAPGKDFADLLRYAKANPGKVTFGTSGLINQMVAEQIKVGTGVDMLHVPFKGSPQMLQALLNGDIDFSVTTFTPYAAFVKDGKLRGIAVTGTNREPPVPDTPSLAELGYPDLAYRQWLALFAPAGLPPPVMERLIRETAKLLADPEIKQRFAAAGIDPAPNTPEQMSAVIRRDQDKWAKVIKAAGIKLE
jgi:tripartite-type tricarboxylate transporter receptor subunit TctC